MSTTLPIAPHNSTSAFGKLTFPDSAAIHLCLDNWWFVKGTGIQVEQNNPYLFIPYDRKRSFSTAWPRTLAKKVLPNDDQPGLLAAYRWDGESEFDDSKFCYVE